MMSQPWAVVLAAGAGTRMNSSLPKVLHKLCGKPMLWHLLRSLTNMTFRQLLVVGYGKEQVMDYFGSEYVYVEQEKQLGTGHALLKALPHLPDSGEVLVLCGDTPLLQEEVLYNFLEHHRSQNSAATILTAEIEDPTGYGRIIRDAGNQVVQIVEQLHLTPSQEKINEINTGSYCFDLSVLKRFLPLLTPNEEKGEYYLTDVLPLILSEGFTIEAFKLNQAEPALGINDRVQLAQATALIRERINRELMTSGVTMIDPASTYIDVDVEVGKDTIIYPQTTLEGNTVVGENCTIGPGTHLVNARVGNKVTCKQSVVTDSSIKDNAQVGPFAHIRPGSSVGNAAKIGNFVEIKNSSIEKESKVPHLSYVGDARIGQRVNFGAGCIVVNYDGNRKHETYIEENAFIGCNSSLIAPLSIGKGAFVAAGSTVNRDVPSDCLAISRADQKNKEKLARRFLKKNDE